MHEQEIGNRIAIRRWFDEVWNDRNEAVIYELFHPDTIVHGITSAGAPSWGVENFVIYYRQMIKAIPDIHITVSHVLAEGDLTSVRGEVFGTHVGHMNGIMATGRSFRISTQCISQWCNGQVVESWNEIDQLGLMRQLGLAA